MNASLRLVARTLGVLSLAFAVHGCASEDSGVQPRPDAVAKTAAVTTPAKAYFRPKGTGPAYWGPGDLYTFLATGEETNNAYFQFEAIVPKGGGPPPHIHLGEEESFYLVQGTLEMRLGDKTVTAKPGDFVNIPRGTVHNFKNIGNDTAIMVATFVPAGMEKYFQEVFPVATDRAATPPPVTPALIKKMTEAAHKHRVEFVPPPAAAKP